MTIQVTGVAATAGQITTLKTDLALNLVDNTADASKPVSTAQATALSAKQATLVSGTNIRTVNGNTLLGSTDLVIAGSGLAMTPDVVSATTYTLVAGDNGKNKVFTNAAGCAITVNTGLGASFFCFISKSAAAGTLTFAGTAVITSDSGSTDISASSAVCLLVPTATDVYDLQGPTGPAVGAALPLNPTDITATRALTAADFGSGILRINAAGVVAITLPTVASMSLGATAGQVRQVVFEIIGAGIPTFAGATASTFLNGTAGTAVVTPIGGAPVQYGYVTLTQTASGANTWSLYSTSSGGAGLPVNNPAFTGQISGPRGTAVAPSYATGILSEQMGFYSPSASVTRYGVGGSDVLEFSSNGYLRMSILGRGLALLEGVNGMCGEATLVAGTVTVSNAQIAAMSRIMLTVKTLGGTQGFLRTSRVNGTSFTITSSSATDTSSVEYLITQGV